MLENGARCNEIMTLIVTTSDLSVMIVWLVGPSLHEFAVAQAFMVSLRELASFVQDLPDVCETAPPRTCSGATLS